MGILLLIEYMLTIPQPLHVDSGTPGSFREKIVQYQFLFRFPYNFVISDCCIGFVMIRWLVAPTAKTREIWITIRVFMESKGILLGKWSPTTGSWCDKNQQKQRCFVGKSRNASKIAWKKNAKTIEKMQKQSPMEQRFKFKPLSCSISWYHFLNFFSAWMDLASLKNSS